MAAGVASTVTVCYFWLRDNKKVSSGSLAKSDKGQFLIILDSLNLLKGMQLAPEYFHSLHKCPNH